MKTIGVVAVALWFAGCATAPAPAPVAPPPAASVVTVKQAVERVEPVEPPPLLWEVEGPRGPLYLFGTMHFGVSTQQLPRTVQRALEQSEVFVLESDPTTADAVELSDMMMLPRGPGLEEQLGPDRWERLLTLLGGTFDERVATRLRPWVLEAVVIQRLLPTEHPMELALLESARDRQMEVAFLESWQTQIELLNSVTTPQALIDLVDDPEGFRERTRQMSLDYMSGDVLALEGHVFDPAYTADALFEERNREWLPRISELVARGRVFVAVGAGHLIGDDSVIAMLEREGYKVRRIESDAR